MPCIAEDGGAPPAAAATAAAAVGDAQIGVVVPGVRTSTSDSDSTSASTGNADRLEPQPSDKQSSGPVGSEDSSPYSSDIKLASGSNGTVSPPISPPATPSDASGPATPSFLRPRLSCHLLPSWGGANALSVSAPAGCCGLAPQRLVGGAWVEAAAARAHRLRRTVSG
eukprot:XP_001699751.1 predicted protein [Chlamydomonas reinhardtii]